MNTTPENNNTNETKHTAKNIPELKAAIEGSATINRRLLIVFLLSMIYFLIIAATTTDFQLLIPDSTVTLPILNVQIDLFKFYFIAPLIIVFVHFNFLFSLFNHTGKLYEYTKFVTKEEQHLTPFVFNLIEEKPQKKSLEFWVKMAIWFVIYAFPLLILMYVQFRYADYHSLTMTIYHGVVLLLDFSILCFFWIRIVKPNLRDSIIQDNGENEDIESGQDKGKFAVVKRLCNIILGCAINFKKNANPVGVCVLVVVLVFEFYIIGVLVAIKHWPAGETTFRIAKKYRDAFPHLKVTDEKYISSFINIISSVQDKEEERQAQEDQPSSSQMIGKKKNKTIDYKEQLMSDLSVGIKLSGRDLRLANLSGSNLRKSDFSNAQLQGSSLENAHLHGANLLNAQMRWASLSKAQFDKHTNWSQVQLQEASLRDAKLEDAFLQRANLSGADLTGANLDRSKLRSSAFNGAVLVGAKLNNATLFNVELNGADLTRISMAEASLTGVRLQGSDLSSSDLRKTRFQEVRMDSANLTGAKMEGAYFEWTQMNFSTLAGANFHKAQLLKSSLTDCMFTNTNLDEIYIDQVEFIGSLFQGSLPIEENDPPEAANLAGVTAIFSLPKDKQLLTNRNTVELLLNAKIQIVLTLPRKEKDKLNWLLLASSPNSDTNDIRLLASSLNITDDSGGKDRDQLLNAISEKLGIKKDLKQELLKTDKELTEALRKEIEKEMGMPPVVVEIARNQNERVSNISFISEIEKPSEDLKDKTREEIFQREGKFLIRRQELACENMYVTKGLMRQILQGKDSERARRPMLRYIGENCQELEPVANPGFLQLLLLSL